MKQNKVNFLRYPGGKSRMLDFLIPKLISGLNEANRLVEPFAGGCAVFFYISPKCALLSDINPELIALYLGIQQYPDEIWDIFRSFPSTKTAYYKIRRLKHNNFDLRIRAARTLYLNRTCFKGMWRHNSKGEFNIGYGGQDRRGVIKREILIKISRRLQNVTLKCSDFEDVINLCKERDFIFVDPPYRPGEREMIHNHYLYGNFKFDDHKRLAETLENATKKGIKWAMTTSSHPDIINLFKNYYIDCFTKGTGRKIGILTKNSAEVLIRNFQEVSQ